MPKKNLNRMTENTDYQSDMSWRMVLVMLATGIMVVILAFSVWQEAAHAVNKYTFKATGSANTWNIRANKKLPLTNPVYEDNQVLQWTTDKVREIFINRHLVTDWLCDTKLSTMRKPKVLSFLSASSWSDLKGFLLMRSSTFRPAKTLNSIVCRQAASGKNGRFHDVLSFIMRDKTPAVASDSVGARAYYWKIKMPFQLLVRNDYNNSSENLKLMATVIVQRERESNYPFGLAIERMVIK